MHQTQTKKEEDDDDHDDDYDDDDKISDHIPQSWYRLPARTQLL